MNIENYKLLISNLPVRQQSFITKRTTWSKAEEVIEWLNSLNDKVFRDQQALTISRKDIFDTKDLRELIIKTIYWGYTSGMRGNHFINILNHIDLIENAFNDLKQTERPTAEDYRNLLTALKSVRGLGISTRSKLFYFLKVTFNDNPCLILDQRLIDVFASKKYTEFRKLSGIRYENAQNKYIDYIELTNQVSKRLETNGENIEQFLFIFGRNLKQ